MKQHLAAVLPAMVVATVWGYFADLRNGEVGWFIGRVVFVSAIALALSVLAKRRAAR
jgi:uncharacterized membrane protein